MQAILIGVGGSVVGLALLTLLGFLWHERRARSVGQAIGATLGAASLPPFRLTLAPTSAPAWADAADVNRALQGFRAAGYSHCGDFVIPELDGLCLRSFFHRGLGSFGVLYDYPRAGLLVDLVREQEDGTRFTVTSGPERGMDHPPHAPRVRMQLDVTGLNGVSKLHERLVEASRGRRGMPCGAADFAHVFVEHYTQEMDWHIARGGPTADEIRRAAALEGQPEPDDGAMRRVRALWRGAIERFTEVEERASGSPVSAVTGGQARSGSRLPSV